ncbi:hypothetical protein RJ639_040188 [Escallonia herrerae]|uniref:Uncharacterized protein n=1 Tax=Escallonia herrerae TaxID=1293975 RepID=A0AA89B4H0_9ASTE|nr:hypothetical protein RJ639_040188 [Escallonia herrerae]
MSTAVQAQALSLCGILIESKRIIGAHSRHFLALSLLFLLPLSFSLITYPALSQTDSVATPSLLFSTHHQPTPHHLLLLILYSLLLLLLSLSALASITHSTYHGFYGRPVKLVSALKSLTRSLLPLVSTSIASQSILLVVALAFLLFVGLVVKLAETLGFAIDYNSIYCSALSVLVALAFVLIVVYLQVNWSLASVVVVAESKWGLEPLRRSSYLIRGMRSVALSLLLLYGASIGFFVWGNSSLLVNLNGDSGWRSWAAVVETVLSSSFVTLFMLNYVAASTVLYMYCKALHGELASEIAEEFAREYVSLPFDDEKLPHVVSVVLA